ncbi:4-hydroxy-tetrahydrodipicolinate reductase [Allostella humosa]|uniref:4-hydroxy-tetrahydrodipicolinate reductase n=1 Tax=Stella humosa TaxID=94 RepID=UPI000F4B400F|nr:4-hydroxy-tetrahydrodipicolinate reductase [Stella humosa]
MRIGVAGAAGRMGRMLVAEVDRTPGARIAAGLERPGSNGAGSDVGEVAGIGRRDVAIVTDPASMFAAVDVAIDFTAPEATVAHARLAAEAGRGLVIGTTGLTAEDRAAIAAAAAGAAIVLAPNMSLGVNLLMGLVEQVAATLDPDYDIEIVEMHHRHKVDAPSGTALGLGEAAARGRGVQLAEAAVRSRDGHTGARERGTIGFATLRGGDVVGDHTVVFAAGGERLELTHRAGSREIYARGAVRAALWLAGRPPGLYDMMDVLGLRQAGSR